jgi:molecular chaperone DnaK (HSP70)
VIGENSGAALYYGLERSDEKVHNVIFYNLGQSGLKVTLAQYSRVENEKKKMVEEVRILADAFSDKVSGRKFDLILAEHFK